MRILSRLFSFLLFCGVVGVLGMVAVFFYFGRGLPNYQELANYEPSVISRMYANDGRLFAEYAHEKRVFIPIEAIPDRVKQAFLAAEDQNFYKHFGVDVIAIGRSLVRNINRIRQKKRPIGGSTITQQVAKNFLLTETATKVSIERKIKEAILAFRIEHAFTKDHILELYLNEIYLGSGSYGVAAAALYYFNKSLNELNVAEAAFLAGLPKAPSKYNPKRNPELATQRRNYVIQRMLEEGYIGQGEALQAKASPIALGKRTRAAVISAPYFAGEIRRFIIEKYGERSLYEGGLTIRTTLDARLQEIAHETLREGLITYDRRHGWRGAITRITWEKGNHSEEEPQENTIPWLEALSKVMRPAGIYHWKLAVVLETEKNAAQIGLEDGRVVSLPLSKMKWARRYISITERGPRPQHTRDVVSTGDVIVVEEEKEGKGKAVYALRQIPQVSGALVAMDPYTGRVLAMQGGFNFNLSQYNRATQAMRQVGSTFKPFVFLGALEAGLTPSSVVDDSPIAIDMGYGLGVWKPTNHDDKFLGPMTLRNGFVKSRNAVIVRMVHEKVGMKRVVKVAKRFGINEHLPMQLAMVLGAGETTLVDMTNAFAMIANGGKKLSPILIDRIQKNGKTIYRNTPRICKGCQQDLWMNQEVPELVDTRTQVTSPAVAYQMTHLMQGVTSGGLANMVPEFKIRPFSGKTGSTNDFKDAWFVGYSPDLVVGVYVGYDEPRSLGHKEYGSKVAAPIFAKFMKKALAETPPEPFRVPKGIKLVRVDKETGTKAHSGDRHVITEAFRKNSEVPTSRVDFEAEKQNNTADLTGTGEIY